MMKNLPDYIRTAIRDSLHGSHQDGFVFDAYAAAIKIRETFPDAPVSTDDLIDAMMARLGGIAAVEISPPSLIVEIISVGDGAASDEEVLRLQ